MKKMSAQISIALVCGILGFLTVTQFKSMSAKNSSSLTKNDKEEVLLEINNLKKEKEELQKKNIDLSNKLNSIEESAVSEGEVGKEIKESLDKTRMILGQENVQGDGIVLYVNLKSPLVIGQNATTIKEYELTHLVNLLNFSGAQAISINGYRITQQTGIKNASDFIWIGDEARISTAKPIEIKAIGDSNKLKKGITFPGEMEFGSLINYEYTIEEKEDMKIAKSNHKLDSSYLNKVQEK